MATGRAATERSAATARSPDRQRAAAAAAVTGLAIGFVRRGTVLVALTAGGMSAFVAVQYRSMTGSLDLASLADLAASPAIRTLFGVPVALDDPGGFTVWRTGTPVAVLVSVWALLAATRVTRGEEEAGRWALLLAGPLPLRDVVSRHLVVLLTAPLLVGTVVGVALTAAGTRPLGTLLYAAGVALVGTAFAALGTLTAQLTPDRRLAGGLAGAGVGVALLTRMLADGVDRLSWLAWTSPYGLLGKVRPFAADDPLPLVVLAGMSGVAAAAALAVAGRRDAEGGPWTSASARPPRLRWMRSPFGFVLHRAGRGVAMWAVGLAAYFGLVGSLAPSMTRFLSENPRFAELAADAGVTGLTVIDGYAAALFGLLALPVGAVAAGLVSDDAADEAARRLTAVFALPVSRARWAVGGTAAVTAVVCLGLSIVAALAFSLGTALAGADLSLWSSLGAALNGLPVVAVCLGAALFALGWAPRAVFTIGWLPAVGGFLLLALADTFGWPAWTRAASPFTYVADVPVSAPDWPGAAALLVTGALLATAGIARYSRRDLRG